MSIVIIPEEGFSPWAWAMDLEKEKPWPIQEGEDKQQWFHWINKSPNNNKKTEFVGPSPEDLGVDKDVYGYPIVSYISDRKINVK